MAKTTERPIFTDEQFRQMVTLLRNQSDLRMFMVTIVALVMAPEGVRLAFVQAMTKALASAEVMADEGTITQ